MKAINNIPDGKKESNDLAFYFVTGVMILAFVVMVGFLFYAFLEY